MKFSKKKFPITDFLNDFKIFSSLVNISFYLIFKILRKFKSLFPYSTDNTAIIVLHKLGDTVFTIPAIREIHKVCDKITIICFPESVPIYQLAFSDVSYVIVEHIEFYFNERIANAHAKKKLKKIRPSLIIDLTGSMISATLIYSVRARKILGFNRIHFKGIYDYFRLGRTEPQLSDMYLDAITPLIPVSEDNTYRNTPITNNPTGKILIHPFAAWREKEWGLKKFINLANRINNYYKASIVFPPDYIDNDLLDEIKNSRIELILTETTEKLIQCIKDCALFIGNDSGPVNIANYLEKPTCTIYGATNPDYTTTNKEYQLIVQKIIVCSARTNEKFCLIGPAVIDCPGIECMKLLTLDYVYNQISPLLIKYCSN